MKITRREFLPALATFAAGLASLANAEEKTENHTKIKQGGKPVSDVDLPENNDSDLIKTLRWIDPNLSGLVINLTYAFSEPVIFYKMNYKKLQEGSSDIDKADLIHNTSDKWANAMSSAISYFLTYAARFPFTAWVASESKESSPDVRRQNRVFSDFMTINTYYGQTFADRYLTNAFQHELREAYKKILQENPEYKYRPWAISMDKTVKAIREVMPSVIDEVKKECKTKVSNIRNNLNREEMVEWVKSRRNQLDLLLMFLSYMSTFVDVIPLLTADKVKAYTANTATGRLVANLPCNAILARDLLQRLEKKGDAEGYDEERVVSTAGFYNIPLYFVINSGIQSFFDSGLKFKDYSDGDVAYSNLREITGSVIGSIIFMFIQYKLESKIRSNLKEYSRGEAKESSFAKFAEWYIKPNSKKD